jgi:hypothetical protein
MGGKMRFVLPQRLGAQLNLHLMQIGFWVPATLQVASAQAREPQMLEVRRSNWIRFVIHAASD